MPWPTSTRLDGFQIKGGYANRTSNLILPIYTNVNVQPEINGRYGAGINILDGQEHTIINCKFSGNKSSYGGSGIDIGGSSTKIVNCLFEKCESVNNFGVISNVGYNVSTSIINSTIAGCKDYGMYLSQSSPHITNTIIMDNSQGGIRTEQSQPDFSVVGYSLIQGRAASADSNNLNGNTITATQVFTNPANSDYSLLSTSPTRNAGNNMAYAGAAAPNNFGDYDLAHNPRIEANTIDMGAYEYRFQNIPVTGITLNRQTLSMSLGSFSGTELIATIAPANATNQNINWTSSNPNIVSVVSGQSPRNPILGALAVGTSTITATSAEGGFTATCLVTVATPPPPQGTLVIELTTMAPTATAGVSVPISMKAAAIRTPVWIETAQGVYTQVTIGTDWSTVVNYSPSNTSLKIHGAIIGLNCSGPGFTPGVVTGINASGDTALQELSCFNNQITNLNLNGLNSLKELSCYKNQLTNLNITGRNATIVVTNTTPTPSFVLATNGANNKNWSVNNANTAIINTTGTYVCGTISVTGITLNRQTLPMDVGATANTQIVATIAPADATNRNITWTSSNPNIVSVVSGQFPSTPILQALAVGTSTITATTADGGFTATCVVTVSPVPVTGVTLNEQSLTLTVGDNASLIASILSQNATNQNVTWTSSNPAVASVQATPIPLNAAINALSPGTTTITVTTQDGSWTATCNVRVNAQIISVAEVILTPNTLEMTVGTEEALTATVYPTNATNQNVTWTSSNAQIASVNNGVVTALAPGTATITVTTQDGNRTSTCAITVIPNTVRVTNVTLNTQNIVMIAGDETQLTATVSPANATNQNVTWSSSNTNVASINASGIINALSAGEAVMTVTTVDGMITATCNVRVNAATVAVTGVTLNNTNLEITEGSTATLVATISPSNASNKNVNWTSTSPSVALVNANGMVSGMSQGNAIIMVTTQDGGHIASCSVRVTRNQIAVTDITLTPTNLQVYLGEEGTITANITPDNATNKNINWTSANPNVATVNNGVVRGLKLGETTISATTQDGGFVASSIVTVNQRIIQDTSVKLNKKTLYLAVGKNEKLNATILPENTTNKGLTWHSIDAGIASVDKDGEVRAIRVGETKVVVSTFNGHTDTCKVIVSQFDVPVTAVTMDIAQTTINTGEKKKLTVIFTPANATNQLVTWYSSNPKVASVDENGNITGLSAGTTTIAAKSKDGNFTATCEITVIKKDIPVTSIKLNKTTIALNVGERAELDATIEPENATNQDMNWTSSDPSIVKVNGYGAIQALKKGEATITVTSDDGGKTATCKVTVTEKQIFVTGITITVKNLQIEQGGTAKLQVVITPADATNKLITWFSSNQNVVRVDANGNITAVGPGNATITVKTEDGNKVATCQVTVTKKVSVENDRIDSGVRVWTENDVININIKDAKSNINNVEIYNMLGNCVFQTNSPNTEMRIELQSGVYFIRVGDTTHKVVLTR